MNKPLLIGLAALMFLLSPAAEKLKAQDKQPGPAPAVEKPAEAIKAAWKDMYTAKFDKQNKDCEFDYGPDGMKNIYCYLSSVISYQKLVSLSGLNPFVKGPHTKEELNLYSTDSFGHYNKEFVAWLADNLIPGAADEKLRWITTPVFNKYFKNTARIYYLAYQKLNSDKDFLEKEVKEFSAALDGQNLDQYWFTKYYDFLEEEAYQKHYGPDAYLKNVVGCAVAFWIRRQVDGTAEEFFRGLTKLIKTYDAGFLTAAAVIKPAKPPVAPPAVSPPAVGPPAVLPPAVATKPPAAFEPVPAPTPKKRTAADRIRLQVSDKNLLRFLDQLTYFLEEHEWDAVLTFFSPDNYAGQTKLGMGKMQYLAEGLGLGTGFRLDSIKTVELAVMEGPDQIGLITIRGNVTLEGGDKKGVTLFLRRLSTGAYLLEPPVG
ncbi:MAG: hypothetical protein V1742_11860 [Pseudomonadota bacterium]